MAKKKAAKRKPNAPTAPVVAEEIVSLNQKEVHNAEDFDSGDDVEARVKEIHKKANSIFKNLGGTSEWENARMLMSGINAAVEEVANENNTMDDDLLYLNKAQRCYERLQLAEENAFEVEEEKAKKK